MPSIHNTYTDKYPWLLKTNSIEEYLPPEYYSYLLKGYSFNGRMDTIFPKSFIQNATPGTVLELGCGGGRVSEVMMRALPEAHFTLTDLSERMIAYSKVRFSKKSNVSFVVTDSIDFLSNVEQKYDFVYSLWSFSHSSHLHIHRLGYERAAKHIRRIMKHFIRNNLSQGAKFFLMHFDSMSDEQRILMRQWKRVYPEFSDISQQSPSKRILDSILIDMDNRNEIVLRVEHNVGDPIIYESQSELLEIFMNFHLETFFNDRPQLKTVIEDLKRQSLKYRRADGTYVICPGCYIYKCEKR
jgi:SAM-dependent methyltransferase